MHEHNTAQRMEEQAAEVVDFFFTADFSPFVVKTSAECLQTAAAFQTEDVAQVTCRNASSHIREPSFRSETAKQPRVTLCILQMTSSFLHH